METKIKRILTDFRTIIGYQSYYYYGFSMVSDNKIYFSKLNIEISSHEDYRRGSAWIIEYIDGKSQRLYIDTNDRDDINEVFYSWCDVYAKINLNPKDQYRSKVLAIGPSFGIRLWNPLTTIYKSFCNWHQWSTGYKEPLKTYLRDYLYLCVRRLPYSCYNITCNEDPHYMFALSTLWYDEVTFSSTNRLRGIFVRSCKHVFEQFEGGFFYIDSPSVVEVFPKYEQYLNEYGDVLTRKRVTMKKYLQCTEKSLFVFNTPSVCGCHGWKLGEYLAMGKAIISTPLNNVMPGDFVDGKHYLEVKSEKEIREAVKMLHDNPNRILDLKRESTDYFNRFLSPTAVVQRILHRLEDNL